MAHQSCKDCGAQFNTNVQTCPYCGLKAQARKTSGSAWIVALVIGIVGLAAMIHATTPDAISRAGYFKDDARNRIYTFEFAVSTTAEDVRAHAEKQVHTPGQMMAAYYYPAGSTVPRDGVTLAGGIFEVNDVIYRVPGLSAWRYAFMRAFGGQVLFVDCEETPENDLCRQK